VRVCDRNILRKTERTHLWVCTQEIARASARVLSLTLTHAHAHSRIHTCKHTHTHARTHTNISIYMNTGGTEGGVHVRVCVCVFQKSRENRFVGLYARSVCQSVMHMSRLHIMCVCVRVRCSRYLTTSQQTYESMS